MKNKYLIGIVILAAFAAGVFFLTKTPPQTNIPPVQTKPEITQTTPATNSVTIRNFSFDPNVLTVKAGTTVTWQNRDSAVHIIKSDSFQSQELNQGDKFEFTFKQQGTFDYICSVHPSMKGKIIVE